MREIKSLHPDLQYKLSELLKLCEKEKITIGIGECVRTVAEQNALYAKGRTTGGSIVTNATGTSYSSQHQWGIAADFYLKMDIDGDGQTSDDAFNNAKRTFNRVGALAKSIGLGWGGDWKSPVDLPHLYLKNWGSTTKELKAKYGCPENFMKTWQGKTEKPKVEVMTNSVTPSKNTTEPANAKDKAFNRLYKTISGVNLRMGAGTNKNVIMTIPKGEKVICYGYYTKVKDVPWLYVTYGKYTGFVCSNLLK